jgi:hypothetical protein
MRLNAKQSVKFRRGEAKVQKHTYRIATNCPLRR